MLGAWRLLRPATASKGVAIGRVLAMRLGDTAPFFLGMVQALVQETDGRVVITVHALPGPPRAHRRARRRCAQPPGRAVGRRPSGCRRSSASASRQSLVVPSGIASRGRGIEVWAGGAKESTVYEILDRGADFDRVTVF